MASSDLKFLSLLGLLAFLFSASTLPSLARAVNGRVLAEYIGAESNSVKFSDVPINPNVDFRFILSFAIDYKVTGHTASPTNGRFGVFWDTEFLTAAQVRLIKQKHPNVRVAVSLAGDTVYANGKQIPVLFHADSVDSWVRNAVTSLTAIINKYNLDGIDIDYEHFSSSANPTVFADCIGQLITTLRKNHVIQFASIAPFDDVQSHYLALWNKYGHAIDYVNFQFYTYSRETTVPQFLSHFNHASSVYSGGKVLASFSTDNSGGLKPKPGNGGFFEACRQLKSQGKLHGIMIWSADDSKELKADAGFNYETTAQKILA